MTLTFLQNAWFHRPLFSGFKRDANDQVVRGPDGKGVLEFIPEWSEDWRDIWLFATARSRSGRRLRVMLGDDCFERDDCAFADASPQVSYGSSAGKFPADPKWIASELDYHKPTVVVCCGLEAAKVLQQWAGPALVVPHPTSRVVTDALYRDAGVQLLKRGFKARLRFVQDRGCHRVETL